MVLFLVNLKIETATPYYNFEIKWSSRNIVSNLLNRTKSYYLYFWEDYLYWLMEQVVIGIELFTKQFDCNNNQFGCERIQLLVASNPFGWICQCMLELKQPKNFNSQRSSRRIMTINLHWVSSKTESSKYFLMVRNHFILWSRYWRSGIDKNCICYSVFEIDNDNL